MQLLGISGVQHRRHGHGALQQRRHARSRSPHFNQAIPVGTSITGTLDLTLPGVVLDDVGLSFEQLATGTFRITFTTGGSMKFGGDPAPVTVDQFTGSITTSPAGVFGTLGARVKVTFPGVDVTGRRQRRDQHDRRTPRAASPATR